MAKKPVEKKVAEVEVSAVKLTATPTPVATADPDGAASAVGDAGAPAAPAPQPEVKVETVRVEEPKEPVVRAPAQFGLQPNPPLADLNRAAEAHYAAKGEIEHQVAKRVVARAFERRRR